MPRERESSTKPDTDTFDRAAAKRWAKREAVEAEKILFVAQDLRKEAAFRLHDARVKRCRESVTKRLGSIPIEELLQATQNVRGGNLQEYGIRTAADVWRAGESGLNSIPGIGSKSASKLFDLVTKIAATRREDLLPAADPSSWLPSDLNLVRALRYWNVIAPLFGLPFTDLSQYVSLLRFIRKACGWFNWLFSTNKTKQSIRESYASARSGGGSEQTGGAVTDFAEKLKQVDRIRKDNLSESAVMQSWRESSAALIASLEQFIAQEDANSNDSEVLEWAPTVLNLSPDLIQAIDAQDLDTSLLGEDLNLRRYQVFGAKFALAVQRGLLGDDMGLGKTIEALAAIGHCIAAENRRHHVVICPAQLIDNWLAEAAKVLPSVNVYPFRQPGRDPAFADWCSSGGIIITSYEQSGNLADKELPSIGFLISDECHYAKEPTARRSRNTMKLARLAERALLMSGTVLENRASEVINLAAVVDPQAGARIKAQFGDGSTAHLNPDPFRQALGELYLRRNQETVLAELPGTIATDELVELTGLELAAYREQLAARNLMQARIAVTIGGGAESAKMQRFRDIIDECRNVGKKMLIFSYFRSVIDLVVEVVEDDVYVVHGDIRSSERTRRMDAFKDADGFAALVSQITVGGQGLNLQAASVVVLMEPQFKPSTEEQAVARAHRMGQTSRVIVHRIVAQNTIDERIVELTDFKAELFDSLVRTSVLDEAYDESRDIEIGKDLQNKLLDEECERHGVPPSSAA